ncbi:MAG: hydroxylamine oxidase [Desulfobacterales bacterium]|nr:hydroxylamine oxidase [Desulfobacterales bacterium]
MKTVNWILILVTGLSLLIASAGFCGDIENLSGASRGCLACHRNMTPNIYENWAQSRMARVTPAEAQEKPALERRVSFESVPDGLSNVVVGCAECHTMNPDKHKDTFNHQGARVHTVVTPSDCAACHPVEREQYSKNLMAEAYGNLQDNPVYADLMKAANGPLKFADMALSQGVPDDLTNGDSCLFCHGTHLSVEKMETRDTDMGPMDFPSISGWPNQGVGRINPDGSKGSCSACHARHTFAIEMARKPYTCSECHKGPDVPAYKVYEVSKHGNIFNSMGHGGDWDFEAVPWTIGRDFTAPTCAACHISTLVGPNGRPRAERTHQMNDRLAWRIFGPVYAHAHPKEADTTIIKNKDGQPLPTALDATPAAQYLISKKEQQKRTRTMKGVCQSCHTGGWVDGHFERFEHTIETTNHQTKAATRIMLKAWREKAVDQADGLFNGPLERKWVEQWLFYANSTRFASAMGGADYGAFANGRWHESKNPHDMLEFLKIRLQRAGSE